MRGCFRLVSRPLGKVVPLALASPIAAVHTVRWQSTNGDATPPQAVASSQADTVRKASADPTKEQHPGPEEDYRVPRATAMGTMERAAAARREIYDLWRTVSSAEEADTTESTGKNDTDRLAGVNRILDTYKIDPSTPREEDVCRGLGDALDRLLLLCVPLPATSGTEHLERVLQATGRQGRRLSVRTVQHLFARTGTFAEALAIFYALRRCHFAMSMESYHAMLYSLQRLEEEGWALRFHDEVAKNKGSVSEQALDFVLRGVDNQLMPENKPWLGRIMFAEQDNAASEKQTRQSYDELGQAWVERYKGGGSIPHI